MHTGCQEYGKGDQDRVAEDRDSGDRGEPAQPRYGERHAVSAGRGQEHRESRRQEAHDQDRLDGRG